MKNLIEGIKFQTHIIKRQSLEMGPYWNRIPKAKIRPLDNKTILNSLALKRKRRHEYSAQVNIVCKNTVYKMDTVCKMTVCKTREYEDSLREHELQFSLSYTRAKKEKRKKLTSRSFQDPTS